MKLPKHINLIIEHNPHAACYESVADHFARFLDNGSPDVTDADRAACIAANEIWEIQWYPDTPVAFCRVWAATLERALELANEEDGT